MIWTNLKYWLEVAFFVLGVGVLFAIGVEQIALCGVSSATSDGNNNRNLFSEEVQRDFSIAELEEQSRKLFIVYQNNRKTKIPIDM